MTTAAVRRLTPAAVDVATNAPGVTVVMLLSDDPRSREPGAAACAAWRGGAATWRCGPRTWTPSRARRAPRRRPRTRGAALRRRPSARSAHRRACASPASRSSPTRCWRPSTSDAPVNRHGSAARVARMTARGAGAAGGRARGGSKGSKGRPRVVPPKAVRRPPEERAAPARAAAPVAPVARVAAASTTARPTARAATPRSRSWSDAAEPARRRPPDEPRAGERRRTAGAGSTRG
nr:hypothetical protein [Angustibacter aerolatus]